MKSFTMDSNQIPSVFNTNFFLLAAAVFLLSAAVGIPQLAAADDLAGPFEVPATGLVPAVGGAEVEGLGADLEGLSRGLNPDTWEGVLPAGDFLERTMTEMQSENLMKVFQSFYI